MSYGNKNGRLRFRCENNAVSVSYGRGCDSPARREAAALAASIERRLERIETAARTTPARRTASRVTFMDGSVRSVMADELGEFAMVFVNGHPLRVNL